jgi:hypothetical protein
MDSEIKQMCQHKITTVMLREMTRCYATGDSLVAPNEFLHFFDCVYPLHIRRAMIHNERIDWVVLHKGMCNRMDPAVLEEAFGLSPHFANEVFILFGRREGRLPEDQTPHLQLPLEWKEGLGHFPEDDRCGAVVTTLDRAVLLAGCLESISKQFDRILVVDDGSQITRQRNADITAYLGAEYVHLGRNRGHACALNTGIAMLLADLDITWISSLRTILNLSRAASNA